MPYNLPQAGAAVGKSKTAILRAIRRGVISAQRDPVTGGWAIDPAELHRAFPPVTNETPRTQDETGELRARLADAHTTIEDLRRRLDRADDERDRLHAELVQVRLLADQRPRRGWWRWGR